MRRVLLIAGAMTVALAAAPAGAAAKDGVRARLLEPIPADAAPGSTIRVRWTLADRGGEPFGASGIYVRLLGPKGVRPQEAVVEGSGAFAADVAVPDGGVRAVQIGLQGRRTYPDGRTERADALFPLDGPVFEVAGGGFPWPPLAALAPVLALLLGAARIRSRRRRLGRLDLAGRDRIDQPRRRRSARGGWVAPRWRSRRADP